MFGVQARILQRGGGLTRKDLEHLYICLLYTSDAADERSSVDLGGRRIIKKKNTRVDLDRPSLSNILHSSLERNHVAMYRD